MRLLICKSSRLCSASRLKGIAPLSRSSYSPGFCRTRIFLPLRLTGLSKIDLFSSNVLDKRRRLAARAIERAQCVVRAVASTSLLGEEQSTLAPISEKKLLSVYFRRLPSPWFAFQHETQSPSFWAGLNTSSADEKTPQLSIQRL